MRDSEATLPAGTVRYPAGIVLATLSGTLWFIACTPYDLSALAWIAAVPMLIAVDRAPTLRQALLLGWWAGIVENGGGFYWFVQTLERFASLPLAAALAIFVAFCTYQGVVMLIFTLFVRLVRARNPVPFALLCALSIPVCEWLLPELFPYGRFITQSWHPSAIQIAELTGPYGVSSLLMLVNGALYDVMRGGPERRAGVLWAVLLVPVVSTFGAWRMREVDQRMARAPVLAVGVVQPNAASPVHARLTEQQALAQLSALQVQTVALQPTGAQLVVWSEGSYPFRLPRHFDSDGVLPEERRIRRDFTVPVVIGALTADSTHGEAHNSALLIDAAGRDSGRYDKTRLVVFGEYIQHIELFFLVAATIARRCRSVHGWIRASVDHRERARVGWRAHRSRNLLEDILPGYLRRSAALKLDILLNLTSDSRFGSHAEPWQHLALAVFASVEFRTSLVWAVNSGVSAYIDPNGRLIGKTTAVDPFEGTHPAQDLPHRATPSGLAGA